MAFELPKSTFTYEAGEDMSTLASYQHRFVKMASDGQVVRCDTDGEFAVGVLQNNPAADAAATVEHVGGGGVTKIVAAEALTPGDFVGTDTQGRATVVQHTNTGADLGDFALGLVVQGAAAAGEKASILLFGAFRVVTA